LGYFPFIWPLGHTVKSTVLERHLLVAVLNFTLLQTRLERYMVHTFPVRRTAQQTFLNPELCIRAIPRHSYAMRGLGLFL
jgi:hypothetical protein